MLAPYYKLGFINETGMILIALLAGLAFGYILVSVGMLNSRKISAVFYGEDWSVMKIMFSAVVTTMVLTFTAYYFGLIDINLVQLANVNLSGQIVGGMLIGAGMVIGGYCPGTGICGFAIGKIDAIVYLIGLTIGIFIFSEAFPLLENVYYAGYLGNVTISEYFNISPYLFTLLFTIAAVILFYVTNLIRKKVKEVYY